jgi:hypothetical protein
MVTLEEQKGESGQDKANGRVGFHGNCADSKRQFV